MLCIVYYKRQCYHFVLSRQLLSMGSLYVPDIEYQYTVMPGERDRMGYFVWEQTDKWEQCDQICSGTLHDIWHHPVPNFRL